MQPFAIIRRGLGIPLRQVALYADISIPLLHEIENSRKVLTEELKEKIGEGLRLAILENLRKDSLFIFEKEPNFQGV